MEVPVLPRVKRTCQPNVLDNQDRILTSLYHMHEILLPNQDGCSNRTRPRRC